VRGVAPALAGFSFVLSVIIRGSFRDIRTANSASPHKYSGNSEERG